MAKCIVEHCQDEGVDHDDYPGLCARHANAIREKKTSNVQNRVQTHGTSPWLTQGAAYTKFDRCYGLIAAGATVSSPHTCAEAQALVDDSEECD